MDYCLAVLEPPPRPDGPAIVKRFDPPIGRDEFDELKRASEVVREVMDGGLVSYAQQAIANYKSFTNEVTRLVHETGEADAHIFYRSIWERAGACSVLGVAAAVHLFQEQTEAAAERETGGRAQVHQLFRQRYEASPGHYFIYRLRNLMAHQSMGYVTLDLNASDSAPEPRMRVDMERLSAPDAINAAVRAHLASAPGDPDLGPLFDEAITSMRQVFHQALPFAMPSAERDIGLLRDLEPRFRDLKGAWALAEFPPSYDDHIQINFHVLTRDLFAFATRRDT